MIAHVTPGIPRGSAAAPPSKSLAHRLLLCAGLCKGGKSRVRNVVPSQDILATIDCLQVFGCGVEWDGTDLLITGGDIFRGAEGKFVCRESGSTLRFLIPLALLSGKPARFTGWGRLLERPQSVYADLCRERRLLFRQDEQSITVKGPLAPGDFQLTGSISSQFISGLLFALPLLHGNSHILIAPPFESQSYVELTQSALADFGVNTAWAGEGFLCVPGGQRYSPQDVAVEGDWSNAAFLLAMNTLGGQVEVTGLRSDSLQGDRVVTEHLEALSAGRPVIDLQDCPDLGPVLMATAAACHGAEFIHTRRLALKESDRGAAMAAELSAFGTRVTVEENRIAVDAAPLRTPDRVLRGHNDHRIVMALLLLLMRTGGKIDDAQAVEKSYPGLYEQLKGLEIEVSLYDH